MIPLSFSPPGADETRPVSVPTTLALLGHRCSGTCRRAITQLNAEVWLTGRFPAGDDSAGHALVVVDLRGHTGSLLRGRELLRQINLCTRHDGILVRGRRRLDVGLVLASARGDRPMTTPMTTPKTTSVATSMSAR